MKNYLFSFSLIIFIFLILSISIVSAQNGCAFIEKVSRYQDSVRLDICGEVHIIDTNTFDVDTYLSFFNKLVLPEGKKCYCMYQDNFLDGQPILFIDNDTFNLLVCSNNHFAQWSLRKDETEKLNESIPSYEYVSSKKRRAKYNIIPQDTPDGYLQYLFFYEMGEQFALKWHSNYFEKYVLCSEQGAQSFIDYYTNSDLFTCLPEGLKRIKEIDPIPTVELNQKTCTITWLEVETHNGVFQRTYEIKRNGRTGIEMISDIRIAFISTNFLY